VFFRAIFPFMSVDELKKAVAALPPGKLAKFRAWYEEFDAANWERQIERDFKAGKLDKLADEALADFKAGRAREL
jgi:hypothetical protein